MNSQLQTNNIILILAIILLMPNTVLAGKKYNKHRIDLKNPAASLGWIPTSTKNNLCGGYYEQPSIVASFPHPLSAKREPTTISADQAPRLSAQGRSILQGHVTVTQPGRQITADKAFVYRNKKGQITHVDLYGNVHIREAGKLVVSKTAHFNIRSQTGIIVNAIYRLQRLKPAGNLNGWGYAKTAWRRNAKIFDIKNGTYSTCPPDKAIWTLKTQHLHLDQNKERGSATNIVLYVKKIPVFYAPYWNFSITKKRKSGFLTPSANYSKNNGYEFTLPFYWNMAPNYDTTLMPSFITDRGAMLRGVFRYLTTPSTGELSIAYLPNDRAFKKFQRKATSNGSGYSNKALKQLQDANPNRGYISYQDSSMFNENWKGLININYVTDDYYFQDFGSTPNQNIETQLFNQALLNYAGKHWSATTSVQAYQTLHPLNQANISDQYARLPDVNVVGNYPNQKGRLNYQLAGEFIHFEHPHNFATGKTVVEGDRYNLVPSISRPFIHAAGYVTPAIKLNITKYDLAHQVNNKRSQITRIIPIYNIDGGLYFERNISLFHNGYQQTLEPRLYYLYVPYRSQTAIPNFDTTLPPFDYSQLFRTNRFIGYDRIGDANQLAYGITSKLLDNYTGWQKFSIKLAEAYYFQDNRVCLNHCKSDPSTQHHLSPIVGEMSYALAQHWNANSQGAWDPNEQIFDNGGISINYSRDKTHILNLEFNYVRDGDYLSDNYVRLNVSGAWSLTHHVTALGQWDYNLSQQFPQTYLYGLEYDGCCWAIRAVVNRYLLSIDNNAKPTFDTKYYLQIQLRGLGNAGNRDPGTLLVNSIANYSNKRWSE